MRKLIIIGTGSTGKRIHDFVRFYGLYEIIGFAADPEYVKICSGGGGGVKLLTSIRMSFPKSVNVKMH